MGSGGGRGTGTGSGTESPSAGGVVGTATCSACRRRLCRHDGREMWFSRETWRERAFALARRSVASWYWC